MAGVEGGATVRGLDIGCGANMIYPLLGAASYGWSFVGVDITEIADQGARRNRDANPHLAPLLTVRRVTPTPNQALAQTSATRVHSRVQSRDAQSDSAPPTTAAAEVDARDDDATADSLKCENSGNEAASILDAGVEHPESRLAGQSTAKFDVIGKMQPILLPAILPGEQFAFSMCNPPFFESRTEAGLNPHTAHAGRVNLLHPKSADMYSYTVLPILCYRFAHYLNR